MHLFEPSRCRCIRWVGPGLCAAFGGGGGGGAADGLETRGVLALRLEHHTDESGADLHTLREWRRRDWGEGGSEFGWWCTEEHLAFTGTEAVYELLRDEVVELIGPTRYRVLAGYLDGRRPGATAATGPTPVMVAHPAVRALPTDAVTKPRGAS